MTSDDRYGFMSASDARAELAAIGADHRTWRPRSPRLTIAAIVVSRDGTSTARRTAEELRQARLVTIPIFRTGEVEAALVWRAVAAVIRSRTAEQPRQAGR